MAGIDVVIPCYQYGRFLEECVSSALGQDFENVRVLIIDNASTDNSVEIAQELAAADSRIEVVARKKNQGATASYNDGIDWAASEYFVVLCADDLMAPGSFERAVSIMKQYSDITFTTGQAITLYPGDPIPALEKRSGAAEWTIEEGRDFIERYCRVPVNPIASCTAIVRTTAQKRAGYYRPELPHADDIEMWLRLSSLGRIARTTAVQGIYRIHGANMSVFYHGVQTRDFSQIEAVFESFFANEGTSLPNSDDLHRQALRSVGERAYWSALSHLCRGRAKTGADIFKIAFRLCPSSVILPPINYLFRMNNPMQRVAEVVSEAIGWNQETRKKSEVYKENSNNA